MIRPARLSLSRFVAAWESVIFKINEPVLKHRGVGSNFQHTLPYEYHHNNSFFSIYIFGLERSNKNNSKVESRQASIEQRIDFAIKTNAERTGAFRTGAFQL